MRRQTHWLAIMAFVALTSIACGFGIFTDYDFDQPDTEANREGFERHIGFPMPASVSDVYYFADELGADVTYQLGFTADQETVNRIVSELGLTQEAPALDCMGLVREFDWWKKDAVEDLSPYWKSNDDHDYYWFLWFDPASRKVHYLEFSV